MVKTYTWSLDGLLHLCVRETSLSATDAMICKTGKIFKQISSQRMLKNAGHSVAELLLLPLQGEGLAQLCTRERMPDIVFWLGDQKTCLDIKIFYPMIRCHEESSFGVVHGRNEQKKCRVYEEVIQNMTHAFFTPLVLTTS